VTNLLIDPQLNDTQKLNIINVLALFEDNHILTAASSGFHGLGFSHDSYEKSLLELQDTIHSLSETSKALYFIIFFFYFFCFLFFDIYCIRV
jgi:hypothetical protein